MTLLRISLHSMALTMTNIITIILAFGLYSLVNTIVSVNQRIVQGSIAGILSILIFTFGTLVLTRIPKIKTFSLGESTDWIWTYFAAFFWVPLIFTPLHYLTQGYLTSIENITVTWIFQLPVNALALLTTYKILNPGRQASALE
jgi:hypothetical protein